MREYCCDCQYCEWDYDEMFLVCTLTDDYICDADIVACSNFVKRGDAYAGFRKSI